MNPILVFSAAALAGAALAGAAVAAALGAAVLELFEHAATMNPKAMSRLGVS